tara:strand:- start:3629 stop:3811 length:183 start_codon:yes stop_codon:yes gene_type:complete
MSYTVKIPSIKLLDADGMVQCELVDQEIIVDDLDELRTVKIDVSNDGGSPILKVRKYRLP